MQLMRRGPTACQKNLPFFVSIVYGAIHSTFFMYSCEKKTPQPIKTTYRYELLLTQSYRPCPFREESHPLSNWCVCVCITYSYKNMPVADSNDNKNQEENCNNLKWTWIGESAQRQERLERLDLNNAQNDFKMVIKTSKNRH